MKAFFQLSGKMSCCQYIQNTIWSTKGKKKIPDNGLGRKLNKNEYTAMKNYANEHHEGATRKVDNHFQQDDCLS